MDWVRKVRPVLFVAGGLLIVGSLLGARLLAHGSGGGSDPKAGPPPAGAGGSGPIVFGYVDSDPPPVSHGLPPVLQSGEVAEVFVKTGDEVPVGGKLYKFDTRYLETKVRVAERAIDVARTNVRKAKAFEDQHRTSILTQKQRLKGADLNVERTKEGVRVVEAYLRDSLFKANPAERAEELFRNDPERYRVQTAYLKAVAERDAEKLHLDELETADVGAGVEQAEEGVKQAQAVADEARTAVELCTVKAREAGTIERVNVGPGDVLGVSTRTPAVVLVPGGKRVVRAEVEAEFAHRVGPDKIGKPVAVLDNSDPKISYPGTVKRIGTTFLPKRSSEGGFVPNETRVLEVEVEVADPAPPGKPPLRVGQRVKVNFGP